MAIEDDFLADLHSRPENILKTFLPVRKLDLGNLWITLKTVLLKIHFVNCYREFTSS